MVDDSSEKDSAGASSQGGAFPSFQVSSKMPGRARFYVELKPGQTTFVSWKRLMKEFQKSAPSQSADVPVGAHPALEARIAPDVRADIVALQKDPLPPPPNRFNSVIEKIERIYKGGDSSDENENLNDVPDDDQYDTEDSFIDDTELDEYFSVDKAKLKHKGFFVNKGKLERESEPASPPAGPKKRRRRDTKKVNLEDDQDSSKKVSNSGGRLKAAARKIPLSEVEVSPSSEKKSSSVPVSSKQSSKRERREAQTTVLGLEAYRPPEKRLCDVDHGFKDHVASQHAKAAVAAGQVGSEAQKGVSADMSVDQQPSNVGPRLLERENIMQMEQKEAALVSSIKTKSAQKIQKEEDSRKLSGSALKPQVANTRSSPPPGKEVSPARSKGTAFERAFQDLEKGVAQLCPPSEALRESEQGKRNRLPQDVKQKLAKVARLAAKQGRLNDELIERLMGILGHVMRVKTLKRNMKAMIELGYSAMQEKVGRLQDIKREVTEMVKSRVQTLQAQEMEQREISSDDFQPVMGSAEKASIERRYKWDHATEDKICDLYEQYIEGMDENKGPHIRKLYAELAELWPDGWMDNVGIKLAVQRAKDRKKKQNTTSAREESRKRRKPSGKQGELVGAERVSFLDLNLPGSDQVSSEKAASSDFYNKSAVSVEHEQLQVIKSSNMERKKIKLESSPVIKKKVKRKLERGDMDITSLGVKGSTIHTASVKGSISKEIPLEMSKVAEIFPKTVPTDS